jgi:hypothetical protein
MNNSNDSCFEARAQGQSRRKHKLEGSAVSGI